MTTPLLPGLAFDAEHDRDGITYVSASVTLADAERAIELSRGRSFREAVKFIRHDADKYAATNYAAEAAALTACADSLADHARAITKGNR